MTCQDLGSLLLSPLFDRFVDDERSETDLQSHMTAVTSAFFVAIAQGPTGAVKREAVYEWIAVTALRSQRSRR